MPLELDRPAPDFTLPAWAEGAATTLTLSLQRGAPVVLAFYPGDDTPVCTRQLCGYQDDLALLTDLGATLWGISTQDVASHERFAAKRGLTFPLLADTDRAVHRAYSAAGALGLTKRAVFVIDATGALAWQRSSALGLTYADTAALAEVLQSLDSPAA